MGKKKVIVYNYYSKVLLKHVDLDRNLISNARARKVLGSFFHIPLWLQSSVLNEMEKCGVVKRRNQTDIEVNEEKEVFD